MAGLALAAAALVAMVLTLGAWQLTVRLGRRADADAERANRHLSRHLVEFATHQRTLRASRRLGDEQSAAHRAITADSSATLRLITMQIPEQILFSLAIGLSLLGLAGTAIALWAGQILPAGTAMGVIVVAVRFIEPIASLADLATGSTRVRSMLDGIRDVLSAPQVPAGNPAEPAPEVRLDQVTLAPAEDAAPVIEDLSLTLASGTSTALIGPSGAGKTTLLHAIAGLIPPREGQVLVDGRTALPGTASMIFQVPTLFDTTIAENIAVAAPSGEIPDGVLEAAQIPEIAASQSEGWDTPVGDGGRRLSGGQRQRVSIARALASPSGLLLVDEATSALDHAHEAAITRALHEGDRTRVTIAPRPEAVRDADRVIVLDGGRVIADGTPAELADRGGYYDDFCAQRA